MQDFYRWEDGTLLEATMVANTACYKLVADMLYKAHIQAIVDYKARIEKVKVKNRQRETLGSLGNNTCR